MSKKRVLLPVLVIGAALIAGCGARPEPPAAEKPDLAAVRRAMDVAQPAPKKKPIPTSAKLATVKLRITGMHCEGCAGSIVSQLNRMDGVQSASVSAARGIGTIRYAPSMCTPEQLVKRVEKGGFQASVLP